MLALLPFLVVTLVAQASPVPSVAPVPSATPEVTVTPNAGSTPVLPPVPQIAPSFAPLQYEPSADIAGTSGPFVGLSLDDAIAMALARNTNLIVSQSNRRVAGYQIVAAQGAYDLQFVVTPSYSYQKQPSISIFEAGPNGNPPQTTTEQVGASVSGMTASGGQVTVSTSASRTNSDLTLNSYNPYYQTALTLNFTQPLARGLAIDQTRRQIKLAKIDADSTDDAAELAASNAISSVLDAYYDLVAAWKNVAIQEDALRQAKAQSESNARLVKRGAAAPVDVIESDTQVDVYQNNVYSAIQNVASLQNQLKQQILSDPADPIWMANLVPVSPSTAIPDEPTLDSLMVTALRNRPEVAQLRESLRSNDVDVAFYGDQTKPQINLTVGLSELGFAGTVVPATTNPLLAASFEEIEAIDQLVGRVNMLSPSMPPLMPLQIPNTPVPPYTIGGLGQSYSSLFQSRFPQITIGANIGFPLRDRTAEAQYHIALEQRKSLATQEVALIQRLQFETRNALQSYRAARSRLLAATAGRRAAEAVLASEERKFNAGRSTTFLVLQRQVSLATQRGAELQAQTDVQKALVELSRVTGNILSENRVTLGGLGTAPQPAVPLLNPSPPPQ